MPGRKGVPGRDVPSRAGRSAAGSVAIITDSTASLPPDLPGRQRLTVVPLRLIAGTLVVDDDGGAGAAAAIEAASRGDRLTTSRPSPERFAAAFAAAAAGGASAVVCVHVSRLLSGTADAAELAAQGSPVPVRVVDARTIGAGLGLAVLEALRLAEAGRQPDEIAARVERYAAGTGSFFALDSPGVLLAGGRGPAGRPAPGEPGSPPFRLTARPVMRIETGQIAPVERVRTRSAATALLAELAVSFADSREVDVAVEHTSDATRASALADLLAATLPRAGRRYVLESGAAIVAHAGHRMTGVTIAPRAVPG